MAYYRVMPLSTEDVALLRTQPHRVETYITVHPILPRDRVYLLRVASAPLLHDKVHMIQYNRAGLGAGDPVAFARCLPDMTVYVGSSADSSDVGLVRLRGFSSDSNENEGTMYIGETSEIDWQAGQYLTVIDDFNIWPRHIYMDDDGNIFMDRGYYDEGTSAWHNGIYTDQHSYPLPVPILGPDRVAYYQGIVSTEKPAIIRFDASDSWLPFGDGTLSFAWTAKGASEVHGGNTATPTIYYTSSGRYRVDCKVIASYSGITRAYTAHRYVYIYDNINPPIAHCTLEQCEGNVSSGGWHCTVRIPLELPVSIRDRAKIILWAREWYGETEQSIATIYSTDAGALGSNIIMEGWVNGESITRHYETGEVSFSVEGPAFWLGKMTGFPHGLRDETPTAWYQLANLTVDKSLWHWLIWRTTLPRLLDCYVTGDTRYIAESGAGVGDLWGQLHEIAEGTILARPVCDRYGRLFVEVPLDLRFVAERTGIVELMHLQDADWRDKVEFERIIVAPSSLLDISGVGYDRDNRTPFFSLALGHIFKRYGAIKRRERLAMYPTQEDNNMWAGLILASENKMYPNVDVMLSGNYRFFDIAPVSRVRVTFTSGNDPRNITWNNKAFCIKSVGLTSDAEHGAMMVDVTLEEETFGGLGMTGDAPPQPPDPGPLPPPPPPPPPPEPEKDLERPNVVFARYGPWAVFGTYNFQDEIPVWHNMNVPSSAGGIHRIDIDQDGHYLYALCQFGLYRCDFTSIVPVWTQILNFWDMPNNLPPIIKDSVCFLSDRTFAVLSDGSVILTGFSNCRACCQAYNPPAWRGSHPILVRISREMEIELIEMDGVHNICCPVHYDSDHWRFHPVVEEPCRYNMAVHDDTVTFPALCFQVWVDGYSHFGRLEPEATTYRRIDLFRIAGDYGGFKSLADIGTDSIIGCYHGIEAEHRRVFYVPLGSGTWIDITPSALDWDSLNGLDSSGSFAYLSDKDRVYISGGGTFLPLLVRTSLDDPPARFYHCSGYADKGSFMLLGCEKNPQTNTKCILYSEDFFHTVLDKTGTGIPEGSRIIDEVRACSTWEPGME